ncbi:MAG: hypothetical protein M1819_003425 [Sarea resinae]|nr:MAG: hypothetical protein M1819_003425 [Sarea resinae]
MLWEMKTAVWTKKAKRDMLCRICGPMILGLKILEQKDVQDYNGRIPDKQTYVAIQLAIIPIKVEMKIATEADESVGRPTSRFTLS